MTPGNKSLIIIINTCVRLDSSTKSTSVFNKIVTILFQMTIIINEHPLRWIVFSLNVCFTTSTYQNNEVFYRYEQKLN